MSARALLAGAALLALAACGQRSETVTVDLPADGSSPAPAAAPAAAAPSARDLSAPRLTPEAEKGEKGARNVLLEWARAVERKDFARAAAQWGEGGLMDEAAHRDMLGELGRITVTLGEGRIEGAAGSSYYEAPVTISDGKQTRSGRIALRRVNDVDGATAEQLRWHIERLEFDPD